MCITWFPFEIKGQKWVSLWVYQLPLCLKALHLCALLNLPSTHSTIQEYKHSNHIFKTKQGGLMGSEEEAADASSPLLLSPGVNWSERFQAPVKLYKINHAELRSVGTQLCPQQIVWGGQMKTCKGLSSSHLQRKGFQRVLSAQGHMIGGGGGRTPSEVPLVFIFTLLLWHKHISSSLEMRLL